MGSCYAPQAVLELATLQLHAASWAAGITGTCVRDQQSFLLYHVEPQRCQTAYDLNVKTWLLEVIPYLKIFLKTSDRLPGYLWGGQTWYPVPTQGHFSTCSCFWGQSAASNHQVTSCFFSPGGDSWADQKGGFKALGTWPRSASQKLMAACLMLGILWLLWCKSIYSLSLKEIKVESLNTLEVTCEPRGYYGASFKKALKWEL